MKIKDGRGQWLANQTDAIRSKISRAGGLAVSNDREYMAKIGAKGGRTVSKDREHMARLGRISCKKGKVN